MKTNGRMHIMRMQMIRKHTRTGAQFIVCCIALLCSALPLSAQSPAMQAMLRRQYETGDFAGRHFGPARWLEDGKAYVTVEASKTNPGARDIVRYDTASGKSEVMISAADLVSQGQPRPLEIENYEWSDDMNRLLIYTNSQRVWRQNTRGDYWVFDRRTKSLKKLGGEFPPATLMFAEFSPDGESVGYVHENNVYVENVTTGVITQLTSDGSVTVINGTSDWVNEEELDIRDAFRWSPDGKRIAYWQFNTEGVKTYTLIYDVGRPYNVVTHIPYPEYGVYPTIRQFPYPLPGTTNSTGRIGVVAATGGATQWMQVPGDPANNYIARMEWAGDSDTLVIQHLNRLQNQLDVLLANANTGAVTTIHSDRDDAWLDVVDDWQWIHGGKDFLWANDKGGWQQIYMISRDGKQTQLETPGNYDVIELLGVTPDEQWMYFIASPENPTQRYLYRCKLGGSGTPERVSPANQPGTHSYDISPDFQWAFHTYSNFDTPPVTELVHLPDHSLTRMLADNQKVLAAVKSLGVPPVEFFRVDGGDGAQLDAFMMKPKGFDPSKKYPVLVYVYGEPAAQTVLDRYESTFHRFIAADGYIVVSIDNRGTPSPRGRAWRKVIYGEVGVMSSKEQAAALQVMEKKYPFMDASRVAVWGWSGGGTNTLNLMFRSPELYKVGMSVAPVADQRLYDTIYQERYMGLPQDNAKGYEESSAINFAEGLSGKLLIVHGSGDDNVHFQGTELLVNRLIELHKQFDFMDYPGRTHAISEGSGTSYHVYSLLARYLEEHVPAGPLP
jgi:dipeptidyl-peptidase 4